MLLVGRALGEILRRIKQPSLVGELLAGMIIGPSLLNLVQPTDQLNVIANFALFFIMLLTGLNLHSKDVIEAGGRAILLSLPAFVVPFLGGQMVASALGLGLTQSLAVGLTLAITAVPVNSIILMELGILKTKLGSTVLTAGVIDSQLSLIMLGVVLQVPANGSGWNLDYGSLALSVGKVVLFVGGVLSVDRLLRHHPEWLPRFLSRLRPKLLTRESSIGLMLIFSIGVALLAESLGLHLIIGAYFAGILLNQAIGDERLDRTLNVFTGATFGVLAPLAFAFIGIEFDLHALTGVPLLFGALLLVAIVGKLAGGYAGARLGGFSSAESRTIGSLLNSRGMVELVIASIVYHAGLINLTLFSVVVGIGIITTTVSPIMARISLRKAAAGASGPKGQTPI